MAVRDENIAVGSRHDTGRGLEMILILSADSRLAECHQHLSVRAELADDVAGFDAGLGCCGDGGFGARVGCPYVALAIHMQPVRPNEHLGAKTFDHVALRVEFIDGVVRLERPVRIHAVETESTSQGGRHRARLVTADKGPDAFSIHVDMHRSRWSHLPAAGKSRPFTSRNAGAGSIRQSPDRTIRIAGGRLSEAHIGCKQHSDAAHRDPPNWNFLRHDTPSSGTRRIEWAHTVSRAQEDLNLVAAVLPALMRLNGGGWRLVDHVQIVGALVPPSAAPVGADKVRVAELARGRGAIRLAPGPEIAASEAAEHGAAGRPVSNRGHG